MFKKINQFRDEYKKWEEAGKPTRSSEKMLEIYEICKNCPEFKKGGVIDSCGVCGCRLHPTDKTIPNKLAWSTTSCPLEEPKWGNEPAETSEFIAKEQPEEQSVAEKDCGCGGKRKKGR